MRFYLNPETLKIEPIPTDHTTELINVNAYNQPGVEAGKKAATEIISLQKEIELNIFLEQIESLNLMDDYN